MAKRIKYSEAMVELTGMFPLIERSVISMVLKTNGSMSQTIESLLQMSQDMRTTVSKPSKNSIKEQDDIGFDIFGPLPDDFLQPPSYFKKSRGNVEQLEQDAFLARMLQDKYFLRMLREEDQMSDNRYQSKEERDIDNEKRLKNESEEDAQKRNRWKGLGKKTKDKFRFLAQKWKDRKNKKEKGNKYKSLLPDEMDANAYELKEVNGDSDDDDENVNDEGIDAHLKDDGNELKELKNFDAISDSDDDL